MKYIHPVGIFDGQEELNQDELERASEIVGKTVTTNQWLQMAVQDRETDRLNRTYGGYVFHETEHGDCQCTACSQVRQAYEGIGQTIDKIVWQAITGQPEISLPFPLVYWGNDEQQKRYDKMRSEATSQALALEDHDLIARASALGDKCWGGHALVNFARATAILAECKKLREQQRQVAS